jgi:hypothetical protein
MKNKKVKNVKEHTYNGVKLRSGLELFCYKKLEESGIKFEYEKHSYLLIDGFTFSSEVIERLGSAKTVSHSFEQKIGKITYKPDFVGDGWIIETKGICSEAFVLRWKLFKRYLTLNNKNTVLYLPRNQSEVLEVINNIKSKNK